MQKLKIGFCSSGKFGAMCLEQIAREIKIDFVVTSAPRRAGRGLVLTPTPVEEVAKRLAIPFTTTERLSRDQEATDYIVRQEPDVLLVIDFGHMVKEPVLSAPKFGCINIHPSAVPEYRGSAPIQRAIMDGKRQTAVSIFRLDEGMDTGDILAQIPVEIEGTDTTETLEEKCATVGSRELLHFLCDIEPSEWHFTPQSEECASLAPKIEKSEGFLASDTTAQCALNKIRALGQNMGTYFFWNNKRIRVFEAEFCDQNGEAGTLTLDSDGKPLLFFAKGSLKLSLVQSEGKKKCDGRDWARGIKF